MTKFDNMMLLHEIGTALLLSDLGIHIQGTTVTSEEPYPDEKVLVVTMRNGDKFRVIVEKED